MAGVPTGHAASIAAGMETTMLTQVADAKAGEEATAEAGAQDDLQGARRLS